MLIPLDNNWSIATDAQNIGREQQWSSGPVADARSTQVPGIIQEVFPGYHGVAWYWREFEAPVNPQPEGRTLLRFGAVDYRAEVWINGLEVGGHEGGETPFVLDVTEAVSAGEVNRLAVRVLNPTNEPLDGIVLRETPHRNKTVPHRTGGGYNYGGIIEPVELLVVPAVRVEELFVRADPNTGVIHAQVHVRNAGSQTVRGRLRLSVTPEPTGAPLRIENLQADLPAGVTPVAVEIRVENARLWDLHDPFLYRVTAHLETGELASFDECSARCGFRDFRVVDGYFRLNGRRIFVRSTHTGNHCPVGQVVAPASAPDLLRRDLLYAKASGFNMVRFIAGVAHPWQLDCCDEIGLMVYEESSAGWCLADSPKMAERFDRATEEMIRRDRSHPSVVIWGLLNETPDGPVFHQAVESLPLIRSLDDSRLVLLSSGRWDNQAGVGSISNPGSSTWEYQWGDEAPGAPRLTNARTDSIMGETNVGMGDVHFYPHVPQDERSCSLLRTLGENSKPVFLSEYGIGSLMNAIRESRLYEQHGENPAAEDAVLMRSMAERFVSDWERYGMDSVYAFPEEMLRESQRLHGRQRLLTFDLVRANPHLCGYNLTGMLDHGMTGEGLWSFWREWKPGLMDVLSDGWAPLRWCLFVNPLHGYAGQSFNMEAVLANEDVLRPGEYPVRFRVMRPEGAAWERRSTLRIPRPEAGVDGPLAVPCLREDVKLGGPAGRVELAAQIEAGAAPAGGRLQFYLSDPAALPPIDRPVTLRGVGAPVEAWLRVRGVHCRAFGQAPDSREVILIGDDGSLAHEGAGWRDLAERIARGSVAVFASPAAFHRPSEGSLPDVARAREGTGWLPLAKKGRCDELFDWLYHKECVARAHPLFDGLPAPGIMDWDYYGPVIPRVMFAEQEPPDEVVAAAFAIGYPCSGGYASGVLVSAYRFGAGRFILNTCRVLENLGTHPAADRLLLNMILYAAQFTDASLTAIPPDFEGKLRHIGYVPP